MTEQFESRRQLLKWLAGSPLLAFPGLAGLAAQAPSAAPQPLPDPMIWAPANLQDLITNPADAINVFDFEPVTRKNVPPAHFGYMASGIDDEVTLRANREGFLKFQLRPRRLVDVSKVDMSADILGVRYDTPIVIAPIGGHRAYHAGGEEAVARAAKAGNHLMILSTQSTTSPEAVMAARGAPIWYQLYATNKWDVTRAFLTRAERAGCLAVAVTVDRNGGRNQETLFRLQRTDTRNCSACHDRSSLRPTTGRRPMYEGVDLSGLTHIQSSAMTWDTIKRMRDTTRMKVRAQGHPRSRRRRARRQGRRRRHHRLEPWGAQRGQRARDDRRAAGDPRRRRAAACRCWSTAASAAAPTSRRRCAWARPPCASAGPISGALARSASRESSACWSCCASSCCRHAAGRCADDQAPRAGDGAPRLVSGPREPIALHP